LAKNCFCFSEPPLGLCPMVIKRTLATFMTDAPSFQLPFASIPCITFILYIFQSSQSGPIPLSFRLTFKKFFTYSCLIPFNQMSNHSNLLLLMSATRSGVLYIQIVGSDFPYPLLSYWFIHIPQNCN
jgi:hypothetical protein